MKTRPSLTPPPSSPLNEGQRFGGSSGTRFVVDGFASHGGQAAVYRAWDSRLERHVAAKVSMARPGVQRQLDHDRFERELRLSSRIAHPHIVEVFDCGELANGAPYVLLEWMPRGSVAQLIDTASVAGGVLPVRWILYYARALAVALRAVHASDVIHRDVKPGNVLIGGNGVAKLADFGVAQDLRPGALSLTGVGRGVGTPGYIASEQLDGFPRFQSDVFAFGIVLYELLTGGPPPQVTHGGTPLGSVQEKAWDVIPEAMRPMFRGLTHDDWHRRPETLDEVLRLLETVLWSDRGRPIWDVGLPPLPAQVFATGSTGTSVDATNARGLLNQKA
jgi:serine/threonine protein kinase